MPSLPQTLAFLLSDSGLPVHDFAIVIEAQQRLVQQYQKTKIQALVGALALPAQDLEDALYQILTLRWLTSAQGIQLDALGRIVGQRRLGLDDPTYQLFLQARILVNKSSGGPEELISALKIVLSSTATLELRYFLPCSFTMTIHGQAVTNVLAAVLAQLLTSARAAGVGAQLIWSTVAPSATFTLDGTATQALDNGALAEAVGV